MKVKNMTSSRGNKVANQFIIDGVPNNINTPLYIATCKKGMTAADGIVFQSYSSIICWKCHRVVVLDRDKWDCSRTTGKYRNQFLGETKRETQKKIDNGEYILVDLN